MVRAALQTDQSEIWWVYLLEGTIAIVFGLLLPIGFLLLSSPVLAALAVPSIRRAAADRGRGAYFLGLPCPKLGLVPSQRG